MKRIRLSRRFQCVFTAFAFFVLSPLALNAQSTTESVQPAVTASPEAANSPEALQLRIGRARALIAAHRLDTAASELESVRSATQDNAIRTITSIMLMSVYLEDGNYGRAEALLEENFQARLAQKDESLGTYFALSGQAVNGARTHLARYRSFGISTIDANLPAEAVSDLNRLRSLLERMIAQAKEISTGRRAYDSLSLLEDVLGIRLSLAKDSEDEMKWEAEYASSREALASSQTQIASLGGIPTLRPAQSKGKNLSTPSPYSAKRISETPLEIKAPDKTDTAATQSERTTGAKQDAKPDSTSAAQPLDPGLNNTGSLNAFATRKVLPRYPPLAKQSGASGLVRVHVIVEGGKVISVSRSEGPLLLRSAAEEAVRQWVFQKVVVAGEPMRLSGYVDFTFTL